MKESHLTRFTLSALPRYVFVPQLAALYDDTLTNFNPFSGLDVISGYVSLGESTLVFPKIRNHPVANNKINFFKEIFCNMLNNNLLFYSECLEVEEKLSGERLLETPTHFLQNYDPRTCYFTFTVGFYLEG